MSRWCRNCGTKISPRKPGKRTRGGRGAYEDRMLCQPCFINPTDEERCAFIKIRDGLRCGLRKASDSPHGYCGIHTRLKDGK